MFMLSCILFVRFTGAQTSKLIQFTAGLTSRVDVFIQQCCDLRSYTMLLLITLVSLHFHCKNNDTLSKSEGYEKYAVESYREKEVNNHPTA